MDRATAAQTGVALALALAPLVLLLLDVSAGRLTANPIQEVEQQTGKAAFLLLLLGLAVTPALLLARRLRLVPVAWSPRAASPFRRVLGWGALAWAVVHFLVFVGLDYAFSPSLLWSAIAEKRFALVGLAALLLLVARAVLPLARRGAGGPRPGAAEALLVPVAAALAGLHYLWAVKVITTKELGYALVTGFLLAAWAYLRLVGGTRSRPTP